MVHEGDDSVGAGFNRWSRGAIVGECDILGEVDGICGNRRDFFGAVVGEAQVSELNSGIALRGGCGCEALLLPATRPTLDLDRRGGELLSCEVRRDKEPSVVVFINQLDIVDHPGAFLTVLGKFEFKLIGPICAIAADTVTPSEFTPKEFLATRTA